MRVMLYAVALAGVLVGMAMVLLGLPEATPAQTVLLELSSLPMSVSVGVGVLLLHWSADRPVGPRSRVVLAASGAAVGLGLLLVWLAYLSGPRELVHTGQTMVWLGLVAALLVMIRRQPRRRRKALTELEWEDEEDGDDARADRGPTASL